MKRQAKPEVYSITGARSGLSDDVADRTKRYLISMGIRTACFIGAVIATGPLRWILLAGALLLPYVAVVVANTARKSVGPKGPDPVTPQAVPGLDEGRRPPAEGQPPPAEGQHPPAA